MVMKIGTVAAVALVAFLAASEASLAASKRNSQSSNSNQPHNYRDVTQCLGGACTSVNPDRVPNQSAQFYRSSHKSGKKQKSPAKSD